MGGVYILNFAGLNRCTAPSFFAGCGVVQAVNVCIRVVLQSAFIAALFILVKLAFDHLSDDAFIKISIMYSHGALPFIEYALTRLLFSPSYSADLYQGHRYELLATRRFEWF